jgi:hypothetical protein
MLKDFPVNRRSIRNRLRYEVEPLDRATLGDEVEVGVVRRLKRHGRPVPVAAADPVTATHRAQRRHFKTEVHEYTPDWLNGDG